MDNKQHQDLIERLDKVTKLLSVIALKDKGKEQDKIELLDMMGFRTSEIARLLNKSPQNISTVLGNLRKKKGPISEQAPTEATSQTETKQEHTSISEEKKQAA